MKYFIAGLLLVLPVFLVLNAPFKPDFEQAHSAFVCNYLGTVCRDKASVLPVTWQRYTP